jgi:hypothetical protein
MTERHLSGVAWQKSSYSGGSGGNCVEVARSDTAHFVRDSKNPRVGALRLGSRAWATLITRIKQGDLDL